MQTQTPASHAGPQGRPAETKTETYLRQIRNMVGILLAIVLIAVAAGIITGIVIAHQASQANAGSTCVSQGGSDPLC